MFWVWICELIGPDNSGFDGVAASRFCNGLCLQGSIWSLNCRNNNFIRPCISCNNIVTKFKNGVRLNFLNLGICTLCTVKKIPYYKRGMKEVTNL
jgi:hypothetical protein